MLKVPKIMKTRRKRIHRIVPKKRILPITWQRKHCEHDQAGRHWLLSLSAFERQWTSLCHQSYPEPFSRKSENANQTFR